MRVNFLKGKGYSAFENVLILHEHRFFSFFVLFLFFVFFSHFTVPHMINSVIRYVSKVTGLYLPFGRSIFGNAHCSLREFTPAKECHESYLTIAIKLGDRFVERNAYDTLGNVYHGLRDFQKAKGYHECDLKHCKRIG